MSVITYLCPHLSESLLTHWGRDKWTPFRRRHFQTHFLEWKYYNLIKISLKFVPKGPIYNNPAMVQIMAWRRPGDKSLSEPMMVSLPTHICVTRPQWVKNIHWAKLTWLARYDTNGDTRTYEQGTWSFIQYSETGTIFQEQDCESDEYHKSKWEIINVKDILDDIYIYIYMYILQIFDFVFKPPFSEAHPDTVHYFFHQGVLYLLWCKYPSSHSDNLHPTLRHRTITEVIYPRAVWGLQLLQDFNTRAFVHPKMMQC